MSGCSAPCWPRGRHGGGGGWGRTQSEGPLRLLAVSAARAPWRHDTSLAGTGGSALHAEYSRGKSEFLGLRHDKVDLELTVRETQEQPIALPMDGREDDASSDTHGREQTSRPRLPDCLAPGWESGRRSRAGNPGSQCCVPHAVSGTPRTRASAFLSHWRPFEGSFSSFFSLIVGPLVEVGFQG